MSSLPALNAWEQNRGIKMSRFLAHWWGRMAFRSDLRGWRASMNAREGWMWRERSPARRLKLGLATMAWVAWASSGRSGESLPM